MSLISRFGGIAQKFLKPIATRGIAILPTARTAVDAAPTISAGTGAPTATEPISSLWLRTDAAGAEAALYISEGSGTWETTGSGLAVIADPGDGGAIPVTSSGVCAITTTGVDDTRTLAIPGFAGQVIDITLDVDAGDAVITVAAAANQTGNNTLTGADAGDHIQLVGVTVAGALVWRIVCNDGWALSTV